MEDDDEFGDLYTDVLRPFASSSSFAPPPHSSPAPPSSNRPIDLNLRTDDDEILYGGSHPNSSISHKSTDQAAAPNLAVAVNESIPAATGNSVRDMIDRDQMDEPRHEKEEDSAQGARDIKRRDAELADRALQDMSYGKESVIDDSRNEVGVKGVDLMDKDVKFDIEEDGDGVGDAGSEPIIPGLSTGFGGVFVAATGAEASPRVDESGGRGEGDDWDSDSEDDLQIVLNDNNHMAMERGGMVGDDDDEDEDGDPLVIVADGDPNQAVEEQEWGEDTAQTADSERKDMGESAKGSGGVTVAPKVGYSNHGFHPFHSQFKYVRPGAGPMPGPTTTAPGGPAGQIRPLGPMAGRGRGDWRPAGMKGAPAMQKGFHSGPGLPVWGNNAAGRGFGGGLDFTLPSHKTIFDVDIDGFEERPWKYPGVDASDFFNFGLNEESWKDYCKQLEQLRLESTMQSKIRVYESGRTEQEFDPDLPPELAAATGIRDVPVENANSMKPDFGQNDLAKGSGRMRPPLPTGRAIQVENGYGERLPSIDTRPPRIRDSDAIIEIVLQDSADDDSYGGNVVQDQPEGETPREDFGEDHVVGDEIPHMENKSFDDFPPHYNGRKRERSGRRMLFMNSSPSNIPEEDEMLPFSQEEPVEYPGSRDQSPRHSGGNFGTSYEERRTCGRTRDQSPCITPSQEITMVDNQKEESFGSMEGRRSAPSSSPVIKEARDSSVEDKYVGHDDTGTADGSSKMEKEEKDLNTMDRGDDLKDVEAKRQKLTSQVEQPPLDEVDNWDGSKASRSSDDSKARSASSREYQKQQDGFEEEVVQDAQSRRLGGIRRHPDENEQGFRRKEHEGKQELDRKHVVHKAREEPYPYKDRHPSSAQQLHTKADGFDRQKDPNSDIAWVRKDDDPYGRRFRNDESRKTDRGKVRENERSDKDDSLHSRKQVDNGSYRVPYDKDVGSRNSRHRERDDSFKSRYEGMEDYHRKRRKDEDYLRRNHIDKEEILSGYKENSNRHRRERDEVLDLWKRDDQQRSKDNHDDHYAVRQKDEGWLLRERSDRQRDREEWQRVKQSHEEYPSKREREGRGAVRSGRVTEEKWVGHSRLKDEHKVSDKDYPSRDTMRNPEQSKRRERILDENSHHRGREEAYAHGNQYSGDERRLRKERSSSRSDHAASASDNPRVHERRHKEGTRKSKESNFSDHNSLGLSKRNQEDQSGQINEMSLKGSGDEGRAENELPGHRLSRKHQEGISSDDEQQDSSRGRSKLERWASHKERDFSINSKSLSSSKFKHIDKDNNDGYSEAEKAVDESAKAVDAIQNQNFLTAEGKDGVDMESKDADAKGVGDRHLDTVEKLKKRSERFKLPMPSEKDALAIKKMESEPLSSAKSENPVDPEVKQERPARKRRWISG